MLYNRRKILLALLQTFDGQLTVTRLQKLLFLFTRTQREKAYDFVPYKYGCFSFQANQDLSTMAKYGLIDIEMQTNGRLAILKSEEPYLSMLNVLEQRALRSLKEGFNTMSQNDLIRYTYQKYPYYAINSIIATQIMDQEELAVIEKQKRKSEESQLFSIGYEGVSLETYINKLIINAVHILCDVRRNAYSQKYGFSKSQLKTACEGVGIEYLHIPELGIESSQRQELHSQVDYDLLFSKYEQAILNNNPEALLRIRGLIDTHKRVALTCFEANPLQCHRTRIINKLMNLTEINYTFKLL